MIFPEHLTDTPCGSVRQVFRGQLVPPPTVARNVGLHQQRSTCPLETVSQRRSRELCSKAVRAELSEPSSGQSSSGESKGGHYPSHTSSSGSELPGADRDAGAHSQQAPGEEGIGADEGVPFVGDDGQPIGVAYHPQGLPRGTVVICGWLGCQEKHLRRYREWWVSQSWEVLTFRMPMQAAFVLGEEAQAAVNALIARLLRTRAAWQQPTATDGQPWRLLFHSFSNTGWFCYGAVVEGILNWAAPLRAHLCGTVVDSAPHPEPSARVWAAGFVTALLPKRPPSNGAIQALRLVLEHFFQVWLRGRGGRRLGEIARMMRHEQDFPQMYIYSAEDHVVPAESVEGFIKSQEQMGRRVRGIKFHASPHVDHVRVHGPRYRLALQQFLEDFVLPVGLQGPEAHPIVS